MWCAPPLPRFPSFHTYFSFSFRRTSQFYTATSQEYSNLSYLSSTFPTPYILPREYKTSPFYPIIRINLVPFLFAKDLLSSRSRTGKMRTRCWSNGLGTFLLESLLQKLARVQTTLWSHRMQTFSIAKTLRSSGFDA